MTIEELVEEFARNVAAQTDAIFRGDTSTGDEHAERYISAFKKLRSAGDAGRDALAVLLEHPRMDVRVGAAACLLRQVVSTRQLVLPTSATGPVPEVRVALEVPTTIIFDAALARDSVKLDGEGTRIRRVDVGDKSIILEPLVELGQERVLLRVRFVDGAAPAEATLSLVSDPA